MYKKQYSKKIFNKKIEIIPGWLTNSESYYLFKLVSKLESDDKIIEIGSWLGRSTVTFALGSLAGNSPKIISIDPHTGSSEHKKKYGEIDTFDSFTKNTKEYGELLMPMKLTSEEAYNKISKSSPDLLKNIKLIFVDGAHEYEFVKKDYELWFDSLDYNGLIAFHDCYQQIGVHLFTTKLLLLEKNIQFEKYIDTLLVLKKIKHVSASQRILNIGIILYRLIFGWYGWLKLEFFGGKRDLPQEINHLEI